MALTLLPTGRKLRILKDSPYLSQLVKGDVVEILEVNTDDYAVQKNGDDNAWFLRKDGFGEHFVEETMDGQTLIGGAKKDDGKPRWELLPYDAVEGAVHILTFGAKKYDARNWEKGIAYGRVFGAIMRHLWKWWHGENIDLESGRSHLDHALCELLFLSAYEKRGLTEFDDRPKPVAK